MPQISRVLGRSSQVAKTEEMLRAVVALVPDVSLEGVESVGVRVESVEVVTGDSATWLAREVQLAETGPQ